jgi:AbrB family transcriptional regulator (stage V sporulation protein T)
LQKIPFWVLYYIPLIVQNITEEVIKIYKEFENMKATGIVRRIDDLGRIVIPKEIRRSFRIKEGDPLEIYTDAEGEVIFKKYSPIGELSSFATQYAEVLHKNGGLPIAIMDNDHVIAASGISKREILERRVTKSLEDLMENRQIHIKTDTVPAMNAIEGYDRQAEVVYPIIYGGDVSGAIAMLENDKGDIPTESDIKLIQVAAAFLGKQME